MRILSVWVLEFIKLLGRRQLHPLNAECPICHQMAFGVLKSSNDLMLPKDACPSFAPCHAALNARPRLSL